MAMDWFAGARKYRAQSQIGVPTPPAPPLPFLPFEPSRDPFRSTGAGPLWDWLMRHWAGLSPEHQALFQRLGYGPFPAAPTTPSDVAPGGAPGKFTSGDLGRLYIMGALGGPRAGGGWGSGW